jgi:exonuclease SbcC
VVPVALKLHNFLSYGEGLGALDFGHFQMACLSGANGHGKSALLDALTFALWGQARRGRGPAGLVRLGATEMWVELAFDQEGQRYRVRRSVRLAGRSAAPTTHLDFFLLDGEGQWRTLSAPTARDTQERIDRLLRMDYATFTNSAFLLQGRADEFTQKTAADRKQILSDILGLSRYDRLCELAKAARAEAERRAAADRQTADRLTADLSAATDLEARLAEVLSAAAAAAAAVSADEQALDALRTRLAEDLRRRGRLAELEALGQRLGRELAAIDDDLQRADEACRALEALIEGRARAEQQAAEFEAATVAQAAMAAARDRLRALQAERARLTAELRVRRAAAEAELARLGEKRGELEAKLAAAEGTLALRERIRADEARQQQAVERLNRCEQAASTQRALIEALAAAEVQVASVRSELELELRSLGRRLDDLRPKAEGLGRVADALAAARADLASAELARDEAEALAAAEAQRQTELAGLKAENERLRDRLTEIGEHERILASGGGRCPVCLVELPADQLRRLTAEYARRREEAQAAQREVWAQARGRQEDSAAAEQQRQRLRLRADRLGQRQREVAGLEHELAEAQAAVALAETLRTTAHELRARLADPDLGGEPAQAARELRGRLARLDYDAADHEHWRRAVEDGRAVLREVLELEAAEQAAAACRADLAAIEAPLAAARGTLDEGLYAPAEQAALAQLEQELAALDWDEDAFARLSADVRRLAEAPLVLRQVAEAERALPAESERRGRLAARRAERVAEREAAEKEAGELAEALLDLESEQRRARDAEQRLKARRDELAELAGQRALLQSDLDRLGRARDELKVVETRLAQATGRARVAEQLVVAFGRNGIPALIIENAVPEIELAANALLARLTDHRMALAIRLQRPLRAGGERETLEIEVSDELGTRSYENYSGGEAFRVNFALRLALSRLLARRAGARLRTLIIDEGFGTQDEDGLEQLIDAIHAVRDEFDLLLVVTHLTALKDRFETRIEVVKEPETGSRWEVVAAG